MDKILALLATLEPAIIAGIGLLALVVVPLIVAALLKHLDERQLRFAYDVARGIASTLDLVDDKTPTKIDDAITGVARQVEEQLGRALKDREHKAVAAAVRKAAIVAGKAAGKVGG